MPKVTIDGKEIEVAPGTSVIQAAEQAGVRVPRFCYHDDLPVDGNCRMCMVEIEKFPKLQIACGTPVNDGMVVKTQVTSEKAKEAQKNTLEFLLVNHPIDCPVCDQAGECYLQDQYMDNGLHDSRIVLEDKIAKRKVVDIGPILLDAERCVVCSRCIRYEREVTKTNLLEFVNRGGSTQISTYNGGPITHEYAGNLVDVCPVGRASVQGLPFQDAGLVPQGNRLDLPRLLHRLQHDDRPSRRRGVSLPPSPQRRGEQVLDVRSRPRSLQDRWRRPCHHRASSRRCDGARSPNSSTRWPEDSRPPAPPPPSSPRLTRATKTRSLSRSSPCPWAAGSTSGSAIRRTRSRFARTRSSSAKTGTPTLRACRISASASPVWRPFWATARPARCRFSSSRTPACCATPAVAEAAKHVPYVVTLATHQGPHLAAAHAVIPAAMWAETDGTFTNFEQRVQRFKRAFEAPGDARPRWETALELLARLGKPMNAATAGDVFVEMAVETKTLGDLTHRSLGSKGVVAGGSTQAQASA